MDFLLIVVAILGFVVAVVMLVLAARAKRDAVESQERAETLEALATGSVLFAHAAADEPTVDEWEVDDRFDAVIPEPPIPSASRAAAEKLELALSEFADEDIVGPSDAGFVMTIPVAAGVGRVQVSFDRSGRRSRS